MTKMRAEIPAHKKPKPTSVFLRLMSLHWWMARLYVLLFVGGWAMMHLPIGMPFLTMMYNVHQSLGILSIAILSWRILVLLQVWWRKYGKRPPKFTVSWMRSVVLHTLLYFWMWAVPISGVFLSNAHQANDLHLFGFELLDHFPKNPTLVDLAKNLHFWFAYVFLAFTILHLIAQWKVVKAHWRQVQKWLKGQQSRWFS
jgi:cytochrome b561